MRKIYKIIVASLIAIIISLPMLAQKSFFTDAGENKTVQTTGKRVIVPQKFRTSSLNVAALRNFLWSLPSEQSLGNNRIQAPVIELPMPDGKMAKFRLWESSIQEPGLQAKFPEIRTFLGQGIDDPYATIRCDFNPYFGFSAQILSPSGRIYIDPYARQDVNSYISYYHRDNTRRSAFRCDVEDPAPVEEPRINAGPCLGTQLRTYRLAVACTAEYAAAVGGGSAGPTHAAIVTSTNRITGVYEEELAIRLVLVSNNNLIEYLANPDPYNNQITTPQLDVNQSNINSVIGVSNYDIGHLFTSNDNGLAQLNAVCGSGKARGATGSPNLVGDGFDIDYVAHEMGHQFGASHSFNSNGCASPGGSYEPGGGTTIMAYAGICAATDNIQPNSDPVFHAISFDQISTFINSVTGQGCAVLTPTGNTLPVITGMENSNVSIPLGTPFTLTGSATDADGDALTYNWEGWDVGSAGNWTSAANSTSRPLFRTRLSKTTGSRTFPDPRVIAANYPGTSAPSQMDGLRGEVLPQVARTMKFRLTVRDNRAGGGGVVSSGDGCQGTGVFQVNAVATSGPFAVTSPNGSESYPGGTAQTVNWNVVGTNLAPFNVANVKISLSTDGGLTFPTVLLNSTANDGTESVTFPSVTSTTARIKVEAVGNIFFDISNQNFTLTTPVAGFDFDTPAPVNVACAGPTSAAVTLGTVASGGFVTPIDLSASNVPLGTSITFGTDPLVPGSSTLVTLNNTNTLANGTYVITITGTAGVTTHEREISFVVQTGTGPSISVQPLPQQACVGTDAVFTAASSAGLSYQWQVSTGAGFTDIGGAVNPSYTVSSVTTALNGNQYRVLVTGQCGVTTSDAATLTVQTAPAISNQPESTTLCLGSNAPFSVTANGTGLSYQWELSTNGGANFSPIGSALSDDYTQAAITTAMNNNQYRVVVSGTCAPPATSDAVTLTVISPVVITDDPDEITICETGNVNFTVAGTSSIAIRYRWEVSTNGGNSYTVINNGGVYSGATTPTLTLTNVTPALNNNLYRAGLFNDICEDPVYSAGAELIVNARPTVTLAANPGTVILPGQSTTITATIQPAATGFDITWYKDNAVIPGITGASYLVDSVAVGDYKVSIINQVTGCNNESQALPITTSASERLFVFPNPSDGQFTVSYFNPSGASTRQSVVVYNSFGAQVYNGLLPVSGPYTLLNINLKGAGKGVYIVVMGDANGKKLTREKIVIN